MNFKLHNKYEVSCGGKTYTAYNTMLKTVFDKIKNLEPYNSYFAFGTGTASVSFNDTKLSSYVASYANATEQIQPDVKKGDVFVVKSKTFGANEAAGLSFSEIGITDTSDSDPIIFNHVVLTDDGGNPVTVTKIAGEEMVVRLTIYLEVNEDSTAKLIAGNNPLVKQILGENALVNKNFVFTKGNNIQPNEFIYRGGITNPISYNYDKLIYNLTGDSGFSIVFTVDYGEGELNESVALLDNVPVLRYNCLGAREATNETVSLTKNSNNTADLGDKVKTILSVVDPQTSSQITFKTNQFATSLGEKVENPFEFPFTSQTPHFVSRNGEYVAFVLNGNFYLYKNSNYTIKQVDATNIDVTGYTAIEIVDDYIFIQTAVSPYLVVYRVVSNACQEVSLSYEAGVSPSFNLTNFGVTITTNNSVMVYGINSSSTYGICYTAHFNGLTNLVFDSTVQTTNSNIEKAVGLYKNNFTDSVVYFLTTDASGLEVNYVESVEADGTHSTSHNHSMAYDIINNSTSVVGINRIILSNKPVSGQDPIVNTYFFPEERRYNIPFTSEIAIYVSQDFNYCIKKFSASEYKIYNLVGYSTPIEFSGSPFSGLDQSTFSGFEFLADSLLIFTTNVNEPIIVLNFNKPKTVIEGLKDADPDEICVSFQKYCPPGANSGENVEATLTITISGFNE